MNQTAYDLLIPTLSYGCAGVATGCLLAASRAHSIPGYALSTGLNFGLLGGTFTGLRFSGRRHLSASEGRRGLDGRGQEIALSGVCGATTGGLYSLLFRGGGRGLLGAVLLYGGLGALGESLNLAVRGRLRSPDAHAAAAAAAAAVADDDAARPLAEGEKSVWRRLAESSPLRTIPNEEFERIMVDKIASLDDQIGLVEQEIQAARKKSAR